MGGHQTEFHILKSILFHRLAARLGIIAIFCAALAQPLTAGEIKLIKRIVLIPERGNVIGYALVGGRVDFGFIPPANWQVNFNADKNQVTLISPDWSTSLSFKVNWSSADSPLKFDEKLARERIQERHFEGKIVNDFDSYAANQRGHSYDLEVVAGNSKLALREVVFPFSHGTMEITLTTLPKKFPTLHLTVGGFLNSLEIKPPGGFSPTKTASAR